MWDRIRSLCYVPAEQYSDSRKLHLISLTGGQSSVEKGFLGAPPTAYLLVL